MAASAEQKARLRRMVAEPSTATYSDTDLAGYIERYPLLDDLGRSPTIVSATSPPATTANPDWTATYDMHAAAADIWDEKAAALAAKFDFTADQQSFQRSQQYLHALKQARYHLARRSASSVRLWPVPRVSDGSDQVGNAD